MKIMHMEELQPLLDKTENEIISYVTNLIESNNATNWQKVSELSFMLRRGKKKSIAVKISKMMYEKSPTMDKLNQYFVAVVDHADILEVRELDQVVDRYLQTNGLGYQKHLFATWLKAANLIQDDAMFERVYGMIPSEEKVENTYIISQLYVFLNRHSRYSEVREHYDKLSPNIKNSMYVRRYYLNASRRMGFIVDDVPDPDRIIAESSGTNIQTSSQNTGDKKVFIVYGNNPDSLTLLEALLTANKIPFSLLSEEGKIGDTIISNFERIADQVALALVLCTPENEGQNGTWYPRQNVIFELGYFRAKIGAQRACILRQTCGKNLELPSDLDGVMYIDMDNYGVFIKTLSSVLKDAGFNPNF